MNRRILFVFVAVAFAAIVVAPSAKADCGSPQQLATAFTDIATNYYVKFAAGQDATNATVVGRFWDANNKANLNNDGGGCNEELFTGVVDPATWYVFGYIGGDAGAGRCVNNGACMPVGSSLMLVFETKTLDGKGAAFATGRVKNSNEIPNSGTSCDYDYSRAGADFAMTPVPRPRVTNSGRAGTTVNLNLHYDDTSGAIHTAAADGFTPGGAATPGNGVLVSYKLLESTGAADPGRNPASWATVKRTDANPGAAVDLTGVPIDCTNPAVPHWIALLPQFQGGSAGAIDGTYVGEAVKINCDPTFAEPKNIKPIGKKKITQ